jgi:CBS domain-containing protein
MAPRAALRLEILGFTRVYEYKPGKIDWMAAGLPGEGPEAAVPSIGGIMRTDVPRFPLDERAGMVVERLLASAWEWGAIVDGSGVLLGRVRASDITHPAAPAAEVMEEGPSTYRPNVPLAELLDRMREGDFDMAFVTDPEGRLLGLVTRGDIEAALQANVRSGTGAQAGRSSGGGEP